MADEQEHTEEAEEEMPEASWPFYVFLVGIFISGALGFLISDSLGLSLSRFRQFALGGTIGVVAVELVLRFGFQRRVVGWGKVPSFAIWLVLMIYFLIFGENDPIGNFISNIF